MNAVNPPKRGTIKANIIKMLVKKVMLAASMAWLGEKKEAGNGNLRFTNN